MVEVEKREFISEWNIICGLFAHFKWMPFYLSECRNNDTHNVRAHICMYIGTDPLAARRGSAFCGRSGVWAAHPTSRDSSRPPAAETRWGRPFCRMCTSSSWGRRGHRKKTFRHWGKIISRRMSSQSLNHCSLPFSVYIVVPAITAAASPLIHVFSFRKIKKGFEVWTLQQWYIHKTA